MKEERQLMGKSINTVNEKIKETEKTRIEKFLLYKGNIIP